MHSLCWKFGSIIFIKNKLIQLATWFKKSKWVKTDENLQLKWKPISSSNGEKLLYSLISCMILGCDIVVTEGG